MDAEDMKTWRGDLTQEEAGKLIGRSARQMRKYEAGEVKIDLTVQLACSAISAGLAPFKANIDKTKNKGDD